MFVCLLFLFCFILFFFPFFFMCFCFYLAYPIFFSEDAVYIETLFIETDPRLSRKYLHFFTPFYNAHQLFVVSG